MSIDQSFSHRKLNLYSLLRRDTPPFSIREKPCLSKLSESALFTERCILQDYRYLEGFSEPVYRAPKKVINLFSCTLVPSRSYGKKSFPHVIAMCSIASFDISTHYGRPSLLVIALPISYCSIDAVPIHSIEHVLDLKGSLFQDLLFQTSFSDKNRLISDKDRHGFSMFDA